MEKEKASELFGVSSKNVNKFTETTPEGNDLTGFICKSRGSNMGAMIIDTVNGHETHQFVRGMPKLHYLTDRDTIDSNPYVLSKLDGTNIVAYPLMVNPDQGTKEVLFKTRLMPHAKDGWMQKINQVFTDKMWKAVMDKQHSFSYELYGVHNRHEAQYQHLDIPELNMDLLCVLEQGKSLPFPEVIQLANKYKIKTVMQAAMISDMGTEIMALFNPQYQRIYEDYFPIDDDVIVQPTMVDMYHAMENFFEKMNMKFQDIHKGGIITEGSVWHYGEEENHMIKCKAMSVREGHIKQACGIPHHDIKKAIVKADENLEEDLATIKQDTLMDFIKDELLEEYSKEMVEDERVKQKAMSILGKYLRKVEIDEEMEQIIARIHNEIGEEATPADKMRVFAELYPNMRNKSSKVYQALVQM